LAKIEIRRLGPGDASVLDRVAEDVFDYSIKKARVAAYLREPGHLLFVAIHESEVVGQARGVIHFHPDMEDELYIGNLGVTPALQRQGIGTKLIEALLAAGKEHGCREAWVGTEADNDTARKFYESLGGKDAPTVFFTLKL
jgi:ribosomal protein S18 acetylase RimI-like enzyme